MTELAANFTLFCLCNIGQVNVWWQCLNLPPLKVKKDENLFFFSDDLKDIFCIRNKNFLENLKNSTNLVNIMNTFQVLVVRRGYYPYEKKLSLQICMN